jgi:ubiquinone biosynthesis protein
LEGVIDAVMRLVRAAWTLGRYDAILPREYYDRLPAPARFVGRLLRLGSAKIAGDPGTRLASALEKLGPAWIKFGQLLATRPDIVGEKAAQGLSRLKDQLEPFSQNVALAQLDAAFGEQRESLFPAIGPVVAAASVAQVHQMTLANGKKVAVKILRPGIEREIAAEGKAMALVAFLAQSLFPQTRRLEPIAFVATIRAALEKELDLRREAGAGDAFGEIVAKDGYFKVPTIDWERTARRVLTTSWVEGVGLTKAGALDGADRPKLANAVTCGFLAAALDHGVFHADMHEGNLILGSDGALWAIDFGIMGRLGMAERRYLAEILYAFLHRDYRRAAAVHIEAGYVPAHYDEGEFAHALRSVGEPIWGKPAREVSMGRVLTQLFDVTEQFGMHMRPELVLLQKTMVQVEGVARAIDPDHDIWEASRPVVERFMTAQLGPEGITRQVFDDVSSALATARKLPLLLARIEKLVERAEQRKR